MCTEVRKRVGVVQQINFEYLPELNMTFLNYTHHKDREIDRKPLFIQRALAE